MLFKAHLCRPLQETPRITQLTSLQPFRSRMPAISRALKDKRILHNMIFWYPLYIGPWNQNVRSLCFLVFWAPNLFRNAARQAEKAVAETSWHWDPKTSKMTPFAFNYHSHLFCGLPIISIARTCKNAGFGSQWYR